MEKIRYMKKILVNLIILMMAVFWFPQFSCAQTGYVSDMLLLTFRQGPGKSYAVTKTLKSNTILNVLEEIAGFFKVELQSGETGWVDKKFIVFTPPKAVLLEQMTRKNAELENKIIQLKNKITALNQKLGSTESENAEKINSLQTELKSITLEKDKLSQQVAATRAKYSTLVSQSRNIQKIIRENKTLHKENEALSKELDQLKQKNKNLFKTAMIKWFLAGVGVLLAGWIMGSSVSRKKRRFGSSLLD